MTLAPGDLNASDNFGWGVAIDDGVILAASRDASGQGKAFVFSVSTGDEIATLDAFDGAAGDLFGASVALKSMTALIGATAAEGAMSGSGAAYLIDIVPD